MNEDKLEIYKFANALDAHIMPPPIGFPSRPTTAATSLSLRNQQAIKNPYIPITTKKVLDEESYLNALGEIIERDFYPHLPSLKRKLDEIKSNTDQYDDFNSAIDASSPHGKNNSENKFSSHSHNFSDLTTSFTGLSSDVNETSSQIASSSPNTTGLSVDAYLSSFTSEDNISFEKLQRKAQIEHRKKFHWMYESQQSNQQAGMLMLYYMNNEVLTAEDRDRFDKLLESTEKCIGDERSAAPETWNFTVRNSLMFPADSALAISNTALINSDIKNTENNSQLISSNTNNTDNNDNISQPSSHNITNTSNSCTRIKKSIQYRNTTFDKTTLFNSISPDLLLLNHLSTPSPLEAQHTPSQFSDSGTSSSSWETQSNASMSSTSIHHNNKSQKNLRNNKLVKMTPSPCPGYGGQSPIVTWGAVCGTPLILDPKRPPVNAYDNRRQREIEDRAIASSAADFPHDNASNFFIPSTPRRELLARSLDKKGKQRLQVMMPGDKQSPRRPNSSRNNTPLSISNFQSFNTSSTATRTPTGITLDNGIFSKVKTTPMLSRKVN